MILKGSQTRARSSPSASPFEYGVILKGSQTSSRLYSSESWFEYGVILKGSQNCALQGVVLSRVNRQDKILLCISNAEGLGDVFYIE